MKYCLIFLVLLGHIQGRAELSENPTKAELAQEEKERKAFEAEERKKAAFRAKWCDQAPPGMTELTQKFGAAYDQVSRIEEKQASQSVTEEQFDSFFKDVPEASVAKEDRQAWLAATNTINETFTAIFEKSYDKTNLDSLWAARSLCKTSSKVQEFVFEGKKYRMCKMTYSCEIPYGSQCSKVGYLSSTGSCVAIGNECPGKKNPDLVKACILDNSPVVQAFDNLKEQPLPPSKDKERKGDKKNSRRGRG